MIPSCHALQVFDKSGLGRDQTYLPKSVHPSYTGTSAKTDLDSAYAEAQMCLIGAVEGEKAQRSGSLFASVVALLLASCRCHKGTFTSILRAHVSRLAS